MSRLGNYALLVVSLLFVAAGIGMVATGAEGGWAALLFFGACGGVAVWQLWPRLLEDGVLDPQVLLKRFPGPVELRVARRKLIFLTFFALVFAGVGISMLLTEPFGWVKTAFLSLGIVFFGGSVPFMLVLLARGSTIRLDRDGFELRQAWRRRFVAWSKVGEFEVVEVPPSYTSLVVFDDAGAPSGALASANAALVGRNSGLPDSYGLSHHELAAFLNAWRALALAGR